MQQLAASVDPNDYVAVLCPRRSGKSHFGAVKALRVCLLKPRANAIIIGLTQASVKRSFWRILDELLRNHDIKAEVNRTDLSFTFENGSYLRLYGAETADRIERLRGDEFDLAEIDEAKSFSPTVLDYLIHEVLAPAVATRDGQIVMVGTPGHIFSGEFYWATTGTKRIVDGQEVGGPVGRPATGDVIDDALWSTHKWTMADNIKVPCDENGVPKQWLRALRDKAKKNWRDDHPAWRRESLGEWVVNEDGLVYALAGLRYSDPKRVVWQPEEGKSPEQSLPPGEWSLLLGIDLGYVDATAFVVVAVSDKPQEMRELHSEKHTRLELSGVQAVYQTLVRRFGGFDAVIVDAGAQGLQIHQTLQTDYGVPGIPAEKRDKQGFIQSLNSDFHSGRIKVLERSRLCEEMTALSYDLSNGSKEELSRKGTLREDPRMENHCSDAMLYLWRYSRHRWEGESVEAGPVYGSREWLDQREAEAKRRAFERKAQEREEYEERLGLFESEEWGARERRAVFGRGGNFYN